MPDLSAWPTSPLRLLLRLIRSARLTTCAPLDNWLAEPPETVHSAGAVSVSVFKQNQSALLLFAPPFDGNDPIRNYTVSFRPAAAASHSASLAHTHNIVSTTHSLLKSF